MNFSTQSDFLCKAYVCFERAADALMNVVEKLEVSPSTVRRGLRELESRGLLRRTHGGAVPVEGAL